MPFIAESPPGSATWGPTDTITLRQLTPARKTRFQVVGSLGFTVDAAGPYRTPTDQWFLLTADYTTDLASVPRFLWGVVASYGRQTLPAVLHDWQCDRARPVHRQRHQSGSRLIEGGPAPDGDEPAATTLRVAPAGAGASCNFLRREADGLFRNNLKDHSRMGFFTRWFMWSAVRLFSFVPLAVTTLGVAAAVWWWVATTVLDVHAGRDLALRCGSALLAALVATAAVRAVERGRGSGRRAFSPAAFGSALGAASIAVVTAGFLAPVVTVTVVTNQVLWVLDKAAYISSVVRRTVFRRAPSRFTAEPKPLTPIIPGL